MLAGIEMRGGTSHLYPKKSYDIEFWIDSSGSETKKESYHKFEPQGVTAMLLLSESHISIHTWPEKKSACLDILSCKNNPGIFIDDIVKLFSTKKYKFKNITR